MSDQWLDFLASLDESTRRKIGSMQRAPAPALAAREWHLVLVPEVGDAVSQAFAELSDVVQAIRQIDDTITQVFVYWGCRVPFTAGPHRHLLTPDGRAVPLFELPGVGEVQSDGRLRSDEPLVTPPPTEAEANEEYEIVEVEGDGDDDDVAEEEPEPD